MKTPFSNIIAGTMTWGIWGKNANKNQMIELINCCLQNEITTFDHADIYGGYTTEQAFGQAFYDSNIPREKIQLISKCGIQSISENRTTQVKHYNYSKEYIIWSVEQSLRFLQTDYLDLLLLHRPSPLMQPDEIAAAITHLKKDGKILDFGVSNFLPYHIDLIQTQTKVNYNQIQFSLTHFEAMINGTLDYMQVQDIRPMAWNPLGSIFKIEDEKTKRLMQLVTTLAVKYDVSISTLLLAWILKHPAGIIPICGTTDKNRITNLTKATTFDMELEDWFAIWEVSQGHKVP